MANASPRILVTGASGQLGRLVVGELLKTTPAATLAALARKPEAVAGLAARGVDVRIGDYEDPAALDRALAGIETLLLISSSAIGQRARQHGNVIDAARRAGVGLIAYTSLLHADTSPLGLAAEHRESEAMLRASGVPAVVLRNGWYTENDTAFIPPAVAHHAIMGSAGEGRFATAARADYAAAAAAVLTSGDHAGRVYELAGDEAYTRAAFAAELARQSGQAIAYKNLPEADFRAALIGAGLPEDVATLLADSDVGAEKGALFDDSRTLSRLIGRPTTPWPASIAAALKS